MANPKLVEQSIDHLIEISNDERVLDGFFHPSSASGPCIRRAVLEKWKEPQVNLAGPGAKRVMAMGSIMHTWVQDAVWRHPDVEAFYPELSLQHDDLFLKGSADGLILLKSGEQEFLEVKTIKSTAMKYGLPKKEHQLQARLYALMLAETGATTSTGLRILPTKVDRIRYFYIGKDTFQLDESIEVLEEKTLVETRRYMEMMNELADAESLDLLPMIGKSWYNDYCPYRGSGKCCADYRKD